MDYIKVGHLKTVSDFRARLGELNLELPVDDAVLSAAGGSPLAKPLDVGGFIVGNRWCVHPMEGWDGTETGEPTAHTLRRWKHFGECGAKLIWGGEAFAVQADGRANPNQLALIDGNTQRASQGLRQLLAATVDAHKEKMGKTDDLLVGLQLTHSGRFCKPYDKKRLSPKIAYHHPLLDPKFSISPDDDSVLLTDSDIDHIIDNYITVAKLARDAGFSFVDVKHCHGYLAHELLSAHTRPGKFGGSLENRTRFARQIIQGIQSLCPRLLIGVRLSAFDVIPFRKSDTGVGVPETPSLPYQHGFSVDNLAESISFIKMLSHLGVKMINVSGSSPYYAPHIQRPAIFPPSDGYLPPEDPLVGVARLIAVARDIKRACPESIIVGSGYTYLQEYLPHVAQAVIRQGWADSVGLGRMVLSYWDLPADTLSNRGLQTKRICRTFSDCTTAPRNGLISGCYPLDNYYKESPSHIELKARKKELKVLK